MPLFIRFVLIIVLPLALGCHSETVKAPQRVLWLTVDSLRADHLGYMGYSRATSPNLDALSCDSVNFRLAVPPSNVTRRSVTAYMTGKYYSQVHDDPRENGLPEDEFTLAEAFKAAGFHTVACTSNFFLRPEEGQAQGFDQYLTAYSPSSPAGNIDELIRLLQRSYHPGNEREFIYVHTMDVHHPYRPPLPYSAEYAKPYARNIVREGNICNYDGSVVISNLPYYSETHDVQPEDVEFLISQYDGAIRYTDSSLPGLASRPELRPRPGPAHYHGGPR